MVLGCSDFHGSTPNQDQPFDDNADMFNTLIDTQCTEYERDYLGKVSAKSYSSPQNDSGNFAPPNICFENAVFFGLNADGSWQTNYSENYCSNISTSDNIEFFAFPQDKFPFDPELYRKIIFGIDPNNLSKANVSNEWVGDPSKLKEHLTKAMIAEDSSGIIYAFLQDTGIGVVTSVGGAVLRGLTKGVTAIADKLSSGTGTETIEEIEMQDFSSIEDTALQEGTEMAEVQAATEETAAADAGPEAAAAAEAAEAEGAADEIAEASSMIPGVGDVVAAAAILISGFIGGLISDDCSYDDFNQPKLVSNRVTGGCCDFHCAFAGKKAQCMRSAQGYNASFFKCCLQDYNCYRDSVSSTLSVTDKNMQLTKDKKRLCFNSTDTSNIDSDSKIATCHPDTRYLHSQICATVVGNYCNGLVPFGENQESILDAWNATKVINFKNDQGQEFSVKAPCLNLIARLLTGNTALSTNVCNWDDFVNANLKLSPEVLDPVGLTIAQDILEKFLQQYLETHGSPVGKINQDGYIESSDFLTWFFNLCKSYPFLCQQSLTNFCSDLTPDDIITNKDTLQWCGCYLKDKYYDYDKFGITKECSPLCNLPDNIPLVGDDGIIVPCTDTTCMIDNFSIKLANVFTDGPINFNQVCASCGGSKIVKKYSSNYSYINPDTFTAFIELVPLTIQDYNNITNFAFFNDPDSTNYKNTSLVGFDSIEGGGEYPINSATTYKIIKKDNNTITLNVTFLLATPIVVPGGSSIIYSISSFSDDTMKLLLDNNNKVLDELELDANDYGKNIFYIANEDGSSPLKNGFFYFRINYFKTGQTKIDSTQSSFLGIKAEGTDTITKTFLESIFTDTTQYNVGITNTNCSCILQGDIDFIDEQVNNLNINNNCGNISCKDDNGDTIPCTDNKIKLNDSSEEKNKIENSEDSIQGFHKLTDSQKTEFITSTTLALFITIVLANFFLVKFPKKYVMIFTILLLLFVVTMIVMYIVYSNSFDISDYSNIL